MPEDITLPEVAVKFRESCVTAARRGRTGKKVRTSIAISLASVYKFSAGGILKAAGENKKIHTNAVKPKYSFIGARFFRKATGGLLGSEGLGSFDEEYGLNEDSY